VEPRLLTAENIPKAYLAALHALFCADSAADEEQDARPCCAWLRPAAAPAAAAPLTREALLQQLLHWCRTSEKLTLPPLQWQLKHRLEEEADTPFALAAPPLPPTAEEKLAEDRIGFLFEAYKPQCYYWEVFELVRKFLLTGVMSMVSPGSAAQVVMGLLVSFAAVVLYSRFNPYLERSVNQLGFFAQLNLVSARSMHAGARMHARACCRSAHNAYRACNVPVPVSVSCAAHQGGGGPGGTRLGHVQRRCRHALPLPLHRAAREQAYPNLLGGRRCRHGPLNAELRQRKRRRERARDITTVYLIH
jgi:hypothetical protein